MVKEVNKMVKFKVINIEETSDQVRITFETKYGIRTLRTALSDKNIHIVTGKPEWMHKVREYIDKKYSHLEDKKHLEPEYEDYLGKEFESEDIEDRSVKSLAEKTIEDRELRRQARLTAKITKEEDEKLLREKIRLESIEKLKTDEVVVVSK